ncbi:hypothetical protein ACI2IX_06775 [Leifsonia aquatica]|uniref:hypothetical protein n=1 Tax=Leifsonia aquatica TaxID=144185 RepID=UPI00384F66BF
MTNAQPKPIAAWVAATELAGKATEGRRRDTPSALLAWVGLGSIPLSFAAAIATNVFLSRSMGLWAFPLTYLALSPTVVGIWLLFWAAPETYIERISRGIRLGETFGRRFQLGFSLMLEASVLVLLLGIEFGAIKIDHRGWWLVGLLGFAALATAMAAIALASGTPIVSVTSKIRSFHGRRIALLIYVLGVCTVSAVTGAGLAHFFNSPAVWPSVVLAIVGIVLGILAQQSRELKDSVDALEEALATLYTELTRLPLDEAKTRAAALAVESAITQQPRGPLSIPPLPLLDNDLRTCTYYLLAVVTRLPFKITTKGQADVLKEHLNVAHPEVLLAELAWEIRRRLFRPAKVIARLDERAFVPWSQHEAPASGSPDSPCELGGGPEAMCGTPGTEHHEAAAEVRPARRRGA